MKSVRLMCEGVYGEKDFRKRYVLAWSEAVINDDSGDNEGDEGEED